MKQFIRLKMLFHYKKLILKNYCEQRKFGIFLIKYIVEIEEKPLRINLKCAYGTINRGLCDEKFVKLEDEPKLKEIFHMIRNKINKIEGVDNMFVAYGEQIKPSNHRTSKKLN